MSDALTDSEKLRTLAAWFDLFDANPDRRAALLADYGESDEVQRDLRRMADRLATPTPEPSQTLRALDAVAAKIDDQTQYTEVHRMYRAGWVDALQSVREVLVDTQVAETSASKDAEVAE